MATSSYSDFADPVEESPLETAANPYGSFADPVPDQTETPARKGGGYGMNWDDLTDAEREAKYGTITAAPEKGFLEKLNDMTGGYFNRLTEPAYHATQLHEPGVLPEWSDVPHVIGGHIAEQITNPSMLLLGGAGEVLSARAAAGSKPAQLALKALAGAFGVQQGVGAVKGGIHAVKEASEGASGPQIAMDVGDAVVNAFLAKAGVSGALHDFAANPQVNPTSGEAGYRPVAPEMAENAPIPAEATLTPTEAPKPVESMETPSLAAPEPKAASYSDFADPVEEPKVAAKQAEPQPSITGESSETSEYKKFADPVDDTSTYGIASRVSEARSDAGNIAPIEPGEGITVQESVLRGRDLIQKGSNPQAVLDDFKQNNRISADDIAVVRARGEELFQAAKDAERKFGVESPEYDAAAKADSDWTKEIKPMQTEWSKIGQAQQGETEVDTGDFHSMRRTFQQDTGKDFTPEQAGQAKGIAEGVTNVTDQAEAAKEEVFKEIDKQNKKSTNSKEPVAGSVQDVWKRAKDYLESGENDFDDIRWKIAADTGLPIDEVTKKLAGPKSIRAITDDMYAKMSKRRNLVDQAKYWLKKQGTSGLERFASQVPGVFFRAKVAGHGTVGMITHAGMNIFNPLDWDIYWPKFFEQGKLLGWHDKGAYHERAMQDLQRDPYYTTARRAGLANSMGHGLDDYEKAFRGSFTKFLSGNRGFDALKIYRQARFSQEWSKTPNSIRTPEYAKALADTINHSTGYVRANFPKVINAGIFAPKLEASRWAFLTGDPVRAGKTFANWKDATPAEKGFAVREVRQKAIMAATYASMLAANQGLLTATGSDQKINYTDPHKPDFLAFKGGGYQFGVVSPLIGSIRYLANMIHASMEERHGAENKDTRFEEMMTLSGKYVRNKLSPFGQFAADVGTQSDWQNRPMPFSNDKVPAYLAKKGIGKYTYPEWLGETFAPIPLEEAIKEVWTDQGMDKDSLKHWMGILMTMAVTGGTGARVSPDYEEQKKQSQGTTLPAHPPTRERVRQRGR